MDWGAPPAVGDYRRNVLASLLGTRDPIQQLPPGPVQPGTYAERADPGFVPGVQPRLNILARLLGEPLTTPQAERDWARQAEMAAGWAGSSAPGGSAVQGVRVFHGSFDPNISALDRARLGQNFPNRTSRQGHWFSTNADDAAFYGDHIYEATINGRFANLPSMEEMGSNALNRLGNVAMSPRVSPETARRASQYIDMIEATRDPNFYTNVAGARISQARRAGYDGAVLRGGETVQTTSNPGDNYVVFSDNLINALRRIAE